jgi:hypothetical protein
LTTISPWVSPSKDRVGMGPTLAVGPVNPCVGCD